MKKLFLLTIFFLSTPCVILFSLVFLSFLLYQKSHSAYTLALPKTHVAYAALPTSENLLQTTITTQDVRIDALRQFFTRYKSPLADYAEQLVNTADKYDLDPRLLPAIAMQESGGCKKIIEGSSNCFGFGIHGSQVKKFEDFSQAIETVAKTLSTQYKRKGLVTPEEIGTAYNPTNTNNWVGSIHYFMNQM